MSNRAVAIALIGAGLTMCMPRTASADAITLNFSGKAYYYDANNQNPNPFQTALTALGVVQDTTPFLLSLTFDPAAPGDGSGKYMSALLGGYATLGAGLEYQIGPSDVSISPVSSLKTLSPLSGPTVRTWAGDLIPRWAGFNFGGGLTAASLSNALSDPMHWPPLMFGLSFDSPERAHLYTQGDIVYSVVQVTSVSVPEPAAILTGCIGLITWMVLLRRNRRFAHAM